MSRARVKLDAGAFPPPCGEVASLSLRRASRRGVGKGSARRLLSRRILHRPPASASLRSAPSPQGEGIPAAFIVATPCFRSLAFQERSHPRGEVGKRGAMAEPLRLNSMAQLPRPAGVSWPSHPLTAIHSRAMTIRRDTERLEGSSMQPAVSKYCQRLRHTRAWSPSLSRGESWELPGRPPASTAHVAVSTRSAGSSPQTTVMIGVPCSDETGSRISDAGGCPG